MSRPFESVYKQSRTETSAKDRNKAPLPDKTLSVIGHSFKRDSMDLNHQTFGALAVISPRSDVLPITIDND